MTVHTLRIDLEHDGAFTLEQQKAVGAAIRANLEGSGDLPGVLGRLNTAPDSWRARLEWLDAPSVPPDVPKESGE